MKPTLLATLPFLLFALTTYFPLPFTQGVEQVKDKNGNPILVSKKYFIWPADGSGGGLRLNETEQCPLVVQQAFSEDVKSLPLKFIPTENINDFIFTGYTSLDIVFEKKTKCAESSKWVVVKGGFMEPWIGIGGGVNGKSVIDGLFKIETIRSFRGYKLVFCPTISDPTGQCNNIGRFFDNENGLRLIMSENFKPFEVVFVDVEDTAGFGRSVV
ncbi:kunitz-type trypsin inhibitor-like 1 protein [Medicago truncatula]|uniref:Kunitz type trypsin inhibitor / Alpha-fucosidase n=1 Tax=Medicago truncatula TaxID=3880 RepID=G7KMU9_MEDTR|nr:kunitz-type trypsin inhibitor-like 1 protein [Medicago truncatula]AES75798.2 Kunitz type trypsin inhibitor / Alpha-fucosidase [Medicago truncatula]